jgi:hypothetical protein
MPASPLKKEDISLPGFGSFPDKIDLKNTQYDMVNTVLMMQEMLLCLKI